VAWAQTLFSERFPSEWIYAQGLLFIVVVGFFPAGFAGLSVLARRYRRRKPTAPQNDSPPAEQVDEPEPDTRVGATT
jgi:urea transport system permease protein